jgi:cytochrome P450
MSAVLGNGFYPFVENPFPFYSRARKEEPVTFCSDLNSWLVTRYDDIQSVLLQPEIFSSRNSLSFEVTFYPQTFQELMKGFPPVPIIFNSDGADHDRFRGPLKRAITPARVKALEPFIRKTANTLVDAFINKRQAEIMNEFAYPLVLLSIHKLLGIPEQDIELTRRWSHDGLILNTMQLDEEGQVACARSIVAFQHYLAGLIGEKKKKPQDDVISLLIADVPGEEPLSEAELVYILNGLILPGNKNPANMIGTGVQILLEETERWRTINEHPEYIPQAVEEIVRFDGPIRAFGRITTQEVTLGGVTLPENAPLLLIYGSGNRDETAFANADEFQLERDPKQHLAFGQGIHYCVGAPLARLEGRIAFEVLTQRLPHLRLVPDQEFVHAPILNFRGYERLEVEW